MDPSLIVSVCFGVAIFAIFFGIDRLLSAQTSTIEARLDRYTARQAPVVPGQPAPTRSKSGRFNRLVSQNAGSQIALEPAAPDLRPSLIHL